MSIDKLILSSFNHFNKESNAHGNHLRPYRVPDPLRTKILQAGAKDLKFVHYTHATEEKKHQATPSLP